MAPILRSGETIQLQSYAIEEALRRGIGGPGVLILTNQRIIFERQLGLFSKKIETEFSVSIRKIHHTWIEGLVRKRLGIEFYIPNQSQSGFYINHPAKKRGRPVGPTVLLSMQQNMSIEEDGSEMLQKRKFNLGNPENWVAAIHKSLADIPEISYAEEAVTREKEIIHQVTVVKIQCGYCGNLYDQSENSCPNCRGPRVSARPTPSLSISQTAKAAVSSFDDTLYTYIVRHAGKISPSTAANELGVSKEQVKNSIQRLKENHRL